MFRIFLLSMSPSPHVLCLYSSFCLVFYLSSHCLNCVAHNFQMDALLLCPSATFWSHFSVWQAAGLDIYLRRKVREWGVLSNGLFHVVEGDCLSSVTSADGIDLTPCSHQKGANNGKNCINGVRSSFSYWRDVYCRPKSGSADSMSSGQICLKSDREALPQL